MVTNLVHLGRHSNEQGLVNWISISQPYDSSSSVEWEEVLSVAPALNTFGVFVCFVFFNAILIFGLLIQIGDRC